MEDRDLLREFREHGSEAAFRTLVERHLGLVHAAARRQVGDAQLAEEVSQAVFLLLARKASSLPGDARLSGWLYRTTCFVARRAARSERRRRQREQESTLMNLHDPAATPSETETWERLAPRLDDALGRLGETDRQALLLRFFEARPHRDVGQALGVGEEAAKKRVARALEKLRALLAGSGVAVSTNALGNLLARHGVEAAPAGLSTAIAQASATATAGGAAGTAMWPVLVRDVWQAWTWAKVQMAGLALAGAALGIAVAVQFLGGEQGPARPGEGPVPGTSEAGFAAGTDVPPRAAVATGSGRSEEGAAAEAPEAGGVLLFRLVDEATGAGVPEATLVVQTVADAKWRQSLDARTDATGFAEIRYPSILGRLDVGVLSEGWGARYVTFFPGNDDPVPPEYTLRVGRSAGTVGGRVEDESGRPVAGAEVLITVGAMMGESAQRETPRERPGAPSEKLPVARTDAEGRWAASVVPRGAVDFSLAVRHPGYAEAESGWVGAAGPASRLPDAGEDLASLVGAGRWVSVLKPARTLAGRLLDGAGRPVAGARLAHEPYSNERREEVTDADGAFAFAGLPERPFSFVALAAGFAPVLVERTPRAGEPPLLISLRPAATLRMRVVDEQGLPVEDAEVVLEQWGPHRQVLPWSARTGADGRLEWGSAPPEEELELCVRKPGWCYSRGFKVTAGDPEHEFRLRPALRLVVRATDAVSGRPLAAFQAFPGYGLGEECWERLATRPGVDGQAVVVFEERSDPWRVRVEAEGYPPFISEPIDPGAVGPLAAALTPLAPGAEVTGTVVGADGRPAAEAEVVLLTLDHSVGLLGRAFDGVRAGPLRVRTDAEGRFRFPPTAFAHAVAAVRDDGFGRGRLPGSAGAVTVRLGAWGRVEGVVAEALLKRPIRAVELVDPAIFEYRGVVRLDARRTLVTPDASGTFHFEQVPPGEYAVWIHPEPGEQVHHKTPVTVEPGATARLRIEPGGPRIRGRFRVSGENAGRNADGELAVRAAFVKSVDPVPPPPRPAEFAATLAAVEYWQSPEGRAWALRGVNHRLRLGPGNAFESETDLPAGGYTLSVATERGWLERRLDLPASADGGDLDLGEIAVPGPETASVR
jgi:RNA polymerase sigma factor (sigma-70 family)